MPLCFVKITPQAVSPPATLAAAGVASGVHGLHTDRRLEVEYLVAPHVGYEHDLTRLLNTSAGRGVGPADGAQRAVHVVPLERLERRARDALPMEQLPTVCETRPVSPARLAEAGLGWPRPEVQVVILS